MPVDFRSERNVQTGYSRLRHGMVYQESTIQKLSSFVLFILTSALLTPFMQSVSAATTPISFESIRTNIVTLGELASRSKNAQLTRSGAAAPYTMSSLATSYRGAYEYQTDAPYGATTGTGHSSCTVNAYSTRGCLTQLRESDERANSNVTTSGTKSGTDGSKTDIIQLTQSGNIQGTPTGGLGNNQMANGEYSFGAIFGPEIYSLPFEGAPGQAVTYQWKATGVGDDYEVYGFLVKISDDTGSTCTSSSGVGSYGLTNPTTTHSILSYGRGKQSNWTTTTGSISQTGCYRFRFVGGTYDASGGLAVGGTFYVYDVRLGLAQTLTFTQPADMIRSASDQTFTAQATSNITDTNTVVTLTYGSDTTGVCTVSGTTVTVKANQTGTCTLRVDSPATGDYGAAPTTYVSFQVLASATKPLSSGGDSITGDAKVCSTLTVSEGSWSDGGSAITSTTYQWRRNGVVIIGATSSTYVVTADDVGSAISYDVTKTNSVGSTTASSTSVLPVDTRLTSLTSSVGTLSPTFNSCDFSYSSSVSVNSLTVTPTLSSGSATLTVNGTAVASGQTSGSISLSVGNNSISIVVTNGTQSSTTTLTISYAQAPTVNILAPTSVTGTGATLNALVNANGQNTTDISFEISTSSTFASDTNTITATPNTASGTSNVNISATSPTLMSETTYYYRAYATNATGTTTSQTFSFTTPAAPFVTTLAAETLTATSVKLNGSVVGNGDAGGQSTTVVFQYSTSSNLSSPIEVSPDSFASIAGGDTSTVTVSTSITGLQTGNTYYFRLKASNNYGTNFGSILSFTLVDSPTVTTQAATNITSNTATLNGLVNANASTTTSVVFRWGTSAGSLSNNLSVTPSTVSGNSSTAVIGNLTGLTQNTTYYYKLSATNSLGSSLSDPVESFTTTVDAAPTATLSAPGTSLTTQPFTVTITFSEAVTGFASSDLALSGATSGWTAQIAQQISTSLYTVEFRPNASPAPTAGNFTIQLPATRVVDSASQANTISNSITVVTSATLLAPDIAYSSYTISATQNSAITTLTPTNSGGIIASWSISSPPSLPTGLNFSTTTGQFSGTPTTTLVSTSFIVTATNSTGSDTATITIEVTGSGSSSSSSATVSGSPIVGVATATSGTTATLTYTAPTNDGGSTITSYIATSSPGGVTASINQSGSGTIQIIGLTPATTYTFTIVAVNAIGNSAPSAPSNAITMPSQINTGLTPTFSSVTSTQNGFTLTITNYDPVYSWSAQVTSPGLISLTTQGFITVTNLTGQGTRATVTVTTSRTGYTSESSSIVGSTLSAPPPPNYLVTLTSPTITRVNNTYVCLPGTYEFVREARFKETPKVTEYIFRLFINNTLVSTLGANPASQSRIKAEEVGSVKGTANLQSAIFELPENIATLPAYCEIYAVQENAASISASNILVKTIPTLAWDALKSINESQPIDDEILSAKANIPGIFKYSVEKGEKLAPGRYVLTAEFTPTDLLNYESVTIKNDLRVLAITTSERSIVSVPQTGQLINYRISSGSVIALSVENQVGVGQPATPGFGIERVEVKDSTVQIIPTSGFSGKTQVVLTITGPQSISKIIQPLLVLPAEVRNLSAQVNSLNQANLVWDSAAGAIKYTVFSGENQLCIAQTNQCTVNAAIGPKTQITMNSLGNDEASISTKISPKVTANFISAIYRFDVGSSQIDAKARQEIAALGELLSPLGYGNFELIGHTDSTAGVNNTKLSRQRAKAVAELLSPYLEGANIELRGRAASDPVASNQNRKGQAQNRRVEVRVIQLP